jgi:hypothetical protein
VRVFVSVFDLQTKARARYIRYREETVESDSTVCKWNKEYAQNLRKFVSHSELSSKEVTNSPFVSVIMEVVVAQCIIISAARCIRLTHTVKKNLTSQHSNMMTRHRLQ